MENKAMSPSNSSTPKPENLKAPAISSSSSSTSKPEKLKGLALSPSNSSTPKPEKLKGLALCSSSSSTPKPEKLKAPIVVKEKATMTTSLKIGSPPEVMSERMIENPIFGSSALERRGDILKLYPPKSNKIFTCPFCKKGFPSYQALGGHQNAHKLEREWEKKRKEMESEFPGLWFLNPYTDKSHIDLLGGCSKDSLSNENHLGITLDPSKFLMYPSFNGGVIGGSTNGMDMSAFPRVAPTSFFTGSTSTIGCSSKVPNPLPNSISPLSFLERNVFPFPSPTTKISGNMVSQENILREENFISKIGTKIGTNNVPVIDDDDMHPEEGKPKTGDIDLSLSL